MEAALRSGEAALRTGVALLGRAADFRIPVLGHYTDREKRQMRFVHAQYTAALREPIPPTLAMNSAFTLPKTNVEESEFHPSGWLSRAERAAAETGGGGGGTSPASAALRTQCEVLLSRICSYQTQRRSRLRVERGHRNDPTNLVLKELKLWAVRSLAGAGSLGPALRAALIRRVRYVEGLLDPEVFPPGVQSDLTMLHTLAGVRTCLRRSLTCIDREIAGASAAQALGRLNAALLRVLRHTAGFLSAVYRNTPNGPGGADAVGPPTVQDLRTWALERGALDAGALLTRDLVDSESFCTLFPRPQGERPPRRKPSAAPAPPSDEAEWVDVEWKQPKRESDGAAYFRDPARTSGVIRRVTMDESVLRGFITAHELTRLLAELSASLRQAERLANMGGHLLLLGAAGGELVAVVASTRDALCRMVGALDDVGKVADVEFEAATRGPQRSRGVGIRAWIRRYTRVALRARWGAQDAADQVMAEIDSFSAQIARVTLQDRVADAKREANEFVRGAERACARAKALLHTHIQKLKAAPQTVKMVAAAAPRRIVDRKQAYDAPVRIERTGEAKIEHRRRGGERTVGACGQSKQGDADPAE